MRFDVCGASARPVMVCLRCIAEAHLTGAGDEAPHDLGLANTLPGSLPLEPGMVGC